MSNVAEVLEFLTMALEEVLGPEVPEISEWMQKNWANPMALFCASLWVGETISWTSMNPAERDRRILARNILGWMSGTQCPGIHDAVTAAHYLLANYSMPGIKRTG